MIIAQISQGIFLNLGITEGVEKTIDHQNVIKSTINFSHHVQAGYFRQTAKYGFDAYYKFNPTYLGFPRWSLDPGTNGGYHVNMLYFFHTVGVDVFKVFNLSKNSDFQISPRIGISATYLFYNRWDLNSVPTTILEDTGQVYINADGKALYLDHFYDRLISDIGLNVKFGCELRIKFAKHFSWSWIPEYSQGLIPIYKVDVWYTDFVHNKSGYAAITSRGSNYGLHGRLSYFF